MKDYKIIKDKYGEEFAKFCRTLFPTILEKEGLLSTIILSKFEPNKYLYEDIKIHHLEEDFKKYIYSFINEEKQTTTTQKTVRELLEEAGYEFYECHTEEDIQSFRVYYDKNGEEYSRYVNEIPQRVGEELCTFNGGRLNDCFVFWAVKKNAKELKRQDFLNPKRQDEYGTSVISIQITRWNNTLSIKNRYNHTVSNPDATFGNNLENIIPGLTEAFEKEYGFKINQTNEELLEIPGYVRANDGKLYKYNYKTTDYDFSYIYYCPNNTIIDNGQVIKLDKSRYILFDYFIYDKVEKKMTQYSKETNQDSFIDGFIDMPKEGTKFNEQNDKETGIRTITITPLQKDPITIEIDKFGRIISYKNPNLTEIKDHFMNHENKVIKSLDLQNVTEIGNCFLFYNESLRSINIPKVKKIGNCFLYNNRNIQEIKLPLLTVIGSDFLAANCLIEEINLPNLVCTGENFLFINDKLKKVNLPNLIKAGTSFLAISLFKIKNFNDDFEEEEKASNPNLKEINVPKLKDKEILKQIKEILMLNNKKYKNKKNRSTTIISMLKEIRERLIGNSNERIEGEENNDEINNNRQK